MFRVAFRLSGDRELALEIVQETWLGAWKNIGQLRNRDQLKSWLFGILRNQYLKSVDKLTRQPKLELIDNMVSRSDGPNEMQQAVQQAIGELDDDQRMSVLLVSMEGWSTQEAADLLGVPQGTVLSRLHRGRQRLKEILSRQLEFDTYSE